MVTNFWNELANILKRVFMCDIMCQQVAKLFERLMYVENSIALCNSVN